MEPSPSPLWGDRPVRLDRDRPYLRIQTVIVFVRDQDRSLRFYLDQLGFTLTFDTRLPSGERWIAVSPPDGSTVLALVSAPKADLAGDRLIGQKSQIVFVCEDVEAQYKDWSARGVLFEHPPQVPEWGGMATRFEDLDGNSFSLVGFDQVTQAVEAQRQALEAQRRAARELDIAKQVQGRLFPQVSPPLATLEYAGLCLQASQVGGDYYDFLDLGGDRLGLVIGDISGKGIAAALLMANLQANLRSQYAAAEDPRSLLRSVNRLFHHNTIDSAYATLFFAEYNDRSQLLSYVNCGHLPGLLLRAGGRLEQLSSTATVLGLFKEWDCSIEQRRLSPGDTLAIYTDGVTETFNENEEEFGEERLAASLHRHRHLPVPQLIASIADDVRRFGSAEQHDDITLIVARCPS